MVTQRRKELAVLQGEVDQMSGMMRGEVVPPECVRFEFLDNAGVIEGSFHFAAVLRTCYACRHRVAAPLIYHAGLVCV